VLYHVPPDWEIDVMDMNLEVLENPDDDLFNICQRFVKRGVYDVIFITLPAVALGNIVGETIRIIKDIDPEVSIIIGGAGVELMQSDVLKFWAADYFYLGDGWEIPAILNFDWDIAGYHGSNDGPINYGKRLLLDCYDPKTFYSAGGRFDFDKYLDRYRKLGLKPTGLLEMTRGCGHKCSFCAIQKSGQVRYRTTKTVLNEMLYLTEKGIDSFYLIDPTFGYDKMLTADLLRELGKIKGRSNIFKLRVITRVDVIDASLVDSMARAGIYQVTLGVETLDKSKLLEVQKGINTHQTLVAIKTLSERGLICRLALMHFPDMISIEMLKFLHELLQSGVKFLVQSSFYRPLYIPGINESVPDFRCWDQRIDGRSAGIDSNKSIFEWMMCNLSFPSTDINCMTGDSDLLFWIDRLKPHSGNNRNIALIASERKYYLYVPDQEFCHIKPNLYVGDDISYLDNINDLLKIDLGGALDE